MGHLMKDEIGQCAFIPFQDGREDGIFQPPERAVGRGLLKKRVVPLPIEKVFFFERFIGRKKALIRNLSHDGKVPRIRVEPVLLASCDHMKDRSLHFKKC